LAYREAVMANLRHVAFITPRLQTRCINHFGFTVDKLEDVMEKLDDSIEHGVNPQNRRPGEMRIIDPWGNAVDVSSRGFLGREERHLPGIRHVVIQSSDPDAACAFYREKFALDQVSAGPDGVTLLTDGDMSNRIQEDEAIGKPGIQYFGVQVDDWEATRARFKELGEELGDPPAPGEERMMTDPEGNPFAVSPRSWLG
jgi:catechol 2,3-dioxygenase-like lactoylglutathione lyase family enzyme